MVIEIWDRYGCQSHGLLAANINAYRLETSAVR